MAKVLVGMSGGVDSSVSAYLLKKEGHDVSGATLKLFDNKDIGLEQQMACSSDNDIGDAKIVAEKLNCQHHVFHYRNEFRECVIKHFADSYVEGLTPNPCVQCNRNIKFGRMLDEAKKLGFDYIATGHYARIDRDENSGRWLLKKGSDPTKDQSYVLYVLTQEELSRTIFPLGSMSKREIREIAEQEGLVTARKKDSQDICFIKDGDYSGFLQKVMGVKSEPGDFIDTQGNKIGTHKGIIHYTVGQRKGLGQTFGRPVYVVDKDKNNNTVTLGSNEDLFADGMLVKDVNLISVESITQPLRITTKARYSMKETGATIFPSDDGIYRVEFDEKQRAITPGQAAVFYQGDVVVGGGTISKAIFE